MIPPSSPYPAPNTSPFLPPPPLSPTPPASTQPPYPLGGSPSSWERPDAGGSDDPNSARGIAAGALVILGSCAVVLGTFLGWVRADIPGVGIRAGNGWNDVYDHASFGPGLTFAALVAAVLAAVAVGGYRTWIVRGPAILASLVALGLAIYQQVDIGHPGAGVTASRGPGLWVMIAGAAVCVLASLAMPGAAEAGHEVGHEAV